MTDTNGRHPFTEAMEQLCRVLGGKPSDWYVQSDERDPYYIVVVRPISATRSGCASRWEERWDRRSHLPPRHALQPDRRTDAGGPPSGASRRRSADGTVIDYRLPEWDHRYAVYENTQWHADFSENALKVGPWVGAFPFSRVFEKRNRNGIKRIVVPQDAPEGWIDQLGADDQVIDLRGIELPTAEELRPSAGICATSSVGPTTRIPGIFKGSPYCPQCFQIVIVGEKTSLEPILRLIAEEYDAHLFLASGDLTNPLVYDIARVGGELDLRPMIILYFTDSDPAGSTMPVVLAWKLTGAEGAVVPEPDRPDPPRGPAAQPGEGVQGPRRRGPGLGTAARIAAEGRRDSQGCVVRRDRHLPDRDRLADHLPPRGAGGDGPQGDRALLRPDAGSAGDRPVQRVHAAPAGRR